MNRFHLDIAGAAALAAAVVTSGTVQAQGQPTQPPGASTGTGTSTGASGGIGTQGTRNDVQGKTITKFVLEKLHFVNQKEIAFGRIAEQRGTCAETKELGRMMVEQHQAADEKIVALARQQGFELDTETTLPAGMPRSGAEGTETGRSSGAGTGSTYPSSGPNSTGRPQGTYGSTGASTGSSGGYGASSGVGSSGGYGASSGVGSSGGYGSSGIGSSGGIGSSSGIGASGGVGTTMHNFGQEDSEALFRLLKQVGQRIQREETQKLQSLSGIEFDRCYDGAMVAGHGEVIAFVDTVKDQVDPSVRTALEQLLPQLEEHKRHAEDALKAAEKQNPSGASFGGQSQKGFEKSGSEKSGSEKGK